jgi:hypothetical protein
MEEIKSTDLPDDQAGRGPVTTAQRRPTRRLSMMSGMIGAVRPAEGNEIRCPNGAVGLIEERSARSWPWPGLRAAGPAG